MVSTNIVGGNREGHWVLYQMSGGWGYGWNLRGRVSEASRDAECRGTLHTGVGRLAQADEKFLRDVAPLDLTDAYNFIDALVPKTGKLLQDPAYPSTKLDNSRLVFTVQDLEKDPKLHDLLPGVTDITTDLNSKPNDPEVNPLVHVFEPDERKELDYDAVLVAAVRVIQDQKQKIANLEARVTTLEAK
jgi:hypothetical protein